MHDLALNLSLIIFHTQMIIERLQQGHHDIVGYGALTICVLTHLCINLAYSMFRSFAAVLYTNAR